TPWQAGTTREGAPDLRYRTRIVIRFLGDDWKQVTIRAEANWQRLDEWDIGYDSKLLEDVPTDLRVRLGKTLYRQLDTRRSVANRPPGQLPLRPIALLRERRRVVLLVRLDDGRIAPLILDLDGEWDFGSVAADRRISLRRMRRDLVRLSEDHLQVVENR